MTAFEHARAVYGATVQVTRTHRDIEFEVLVRVTRRLKLATQSDSHFAELAGALHDNRLLWGAFAAALVSPGNALPADLRGRLLSLARFVDERSSMVLRQTASADILVEINTAIMRGLRPSEVTS